MVNASDGEDQELELSNPSQLPDQLVSVDIDGTVAGAVIAKMVGGFAVGQLTVYVSQFLTEATTKPTTLPVELEKNPYQGLKAFREKDGDRFFGRDLEIGKLLEKFKGLHNDPSTIRVLPVYGPSGSGKSSLVRAGLIPALGKEPLRAKDHSRVVVMTPVTHPLESLAKVLARIATQDFTPTKKTQEFKEELQRVNSKKEFDGLRFITDLFPDIEVSPLIILVDQFEEVYTLCEDPQERDAFIGNLLWAAADRSQHVSVIITMRSDFLGATQQHPHLNKLFSDQGSFVPIMQREELAIAITEPTKRAGRELDRATVQLLIEQSQGQEGALPLLQFALTQIWEGLCKGVEPAVTLEQAGGVGGALAKEAEKQYLSLTPEQQKIARSIFLALIQINDHNDRNKCTRRRAPISELITDRQDDTSVREVIKRFAQPGVWILVTSCNQEQVEMLEVAHEVLIHNWKGLKDWLDEHWVALSKKRKIEQAALEWQAQKRSKGYLLQGRILRNAKEFLQAQKENTETSLSDFAKEFVQASAKKQRINTLKFASVFLVFPLIGTLIIVHLQIVARANSILSRNDCNPDSDIKGLLEYMWWTRQATELRYVKLCNKNLRGIKLPSIVMLNSDFESANLANSNFHESTFLGSSFRGATLSYADFSNTSLRQAKFQCKEDKCKKDSHTKLFRTDFRNSKLEGAQFQGAFLENTDFRGADLTDADLSEAKGMTQEQLDNTIICRTVLPDYLSSIPKNRDCSSK